MEMETVPAAGLGTAQGHSATRTLAGLAADDYGLSDDRAPLVLLHGLTFDRSLWRPSLAELYRIDPGRRVLALDLPGHGASPGWPSYDVQSLARGVHRAAEEAGLQSPVVVGHSICGDCRDRLCRPVPDPRHHQRRPATAGSPLRRPGAVSRRQAPRARLPRHLADVRREHAHRASARDGTRAPAVQLPASARPRPRILARAPRPARQRTRRPSPPPRLKQCEAPACRTSSWPVPT